MIYIIHEKPADFMDRPPLTPIADDKNNMQSLFPAIRQKLEAIKENRLASSNKLEPH